MNENVKSKIYRELIETLSDYFGDKHTVRDIVLFGTDFKGLSNMTDQELLDEYRDNVLCGEEDDDLAKEAEASIVIEEVLSNE